MEEGMQMNYQLMDFALDWLRPFERSRENWADVLGRNREILEAVEPAILRARIQQPNEHRRILLLTIEDDPRLTASALRSFEQSLDGLAPGLYVRLALQDIDGKPLDYNRQRALIPWLKDAIQEQLDPVCACFWHSGELLRTPQGWTIELPQDTHDFCVDMIETCVRQLTLERFQDQSAIDVKLEGSLGQESTEAGERWEQFRSLVQEAQAAQEKRAQDAERRQAQGTASGGPPDSSDNSGPRRRYEKIGNNGLLWGRMPREQEPIPIREFSMDYRDAILEGEIANLEWKAVREGVSQLCKFSVYSLAGSIDAEFFMDTKKVEEQELQGKLRNGERVRIFCVPKIDNYSFRRELIAQVRGMSLLEPLPEREDKAPVKRVEFHCHTSYSQRDAMSKPASLIKLATRFGHPAIAITDHGVVQAFPEIMQTVDKLKKSGKTPPKILYGMEGYLVNDGPTFVYGAAEDWTLKDSFVAFDLETTGLDGAHDRIIEIGAIRYERDEDGHFREGETFHELCDPGFTPDEKIFELTGITEMELIGKRAPHEVVQDFRNFLGDDPVVAHNGLFDLNFLRHEGFRVNELKVAPLKFNPVLIDTLDWSRLALTENRRHRLGDVAETLGVTQDAEHRALDDARTAGEVFLKLWRRADERPLLEIQQDYGHLELAELCSQRARSYHIIHIAQTRLGLYHLYRLVSFSHTQCFYRRPRIPRSLLRYYQGGLLTGAACEAGEVFTAVREAWTTHQGDEAAVRESFNERGWWQLLNLYDYLEVQPTANNRFLLRQPGNYIETEEDLQALNRLVVELARRYHKPCIATTDAHFMSADDEIFRRMMLDAQGFPDSDRELPLYFRTTDELLDCFSYFPEDVAYELVVAGPNRLAETVEPDLRPFPEGNYPPVIETAAENIRRLVKETSETLYGRNETNDGPGTILPEIVQARIDRELDSIIKHGFAIMYYIAHLLVKKSNEDDYIVGSRGSVGSSLIATLTGITEVNPLPPHYRCPHCHYSEFDESGSYGSGFDMPPKDCPECGTSMIRDGQDIPFETFLGFHGDKQPDIDLNFAGEYQPRAHAYTRELFGEDYTFRAGTITTYAEKNALGIVRNYLEKRDRNESYAEQRRLAMGLDGVKNSTGQHPGGIVVVPKDREIYDFTPIQYPANDNTVSMYTTHFDFHALEETILKLDILGHVDPTMLKVLSDYTGVKIEDIPIPDEKVMSLFASTEALGIPAGTAPWKTATLGLPELGTFMARGMVEETTPTRFFDLVQLMGLSHGTDVWRGNAQDLIKNGTCTIDEVIGCRDSIMTNLIYEGLPSEDAFWIMEHVRKGKGLTEEEEALMRKHEIPDWYIDSCKKIKYMFPKAHAAAYVMSSLRIAWFKVYRPVEYYAAFFTVRAKEFDARLMCQKPADVEAVRQRMLENRNALQDRDLKVFYIVELVCEMNLRGIEFLPIDLEHSDAYYFRAEGPNRIRPPFDAINGFSTNMAKQLVAARAEAPFGSKLELMDRAGLGQSGIDLLAEFGVLDGLPDSPQIDLFEFLGEDSDCLGGLA